MSVCCSICVVSVLCLYLSVMWLSVLRPCSDQVMCVFCVCAIYTYFDCDLFVSIFDLPVLCLSFVCGLPVFNVASVGVAFVSYLCNVYGPSAFCLISVCYKFVRLCFVLSAFVFFMCSVHCLRSIRLKTVSLMCRLNMFVCVLYVCCLSSDNILFASICVIYVFCLSYGCALSMCCLRSFRLLYVTHLCFVCCLSVCVHP